VGQAARARGGEASSGVGGARRAADVADVAMALAGVAGGRAEAGGWTEVDADEEEAAEAASDGARKARRGAGPLAPERERLYLEAAEVT